MDDYFAAKRRLFELLPEQAVAVVNLDDRRGAELTGIASRTVTYAIDAAADVVPVDLRSSLDGLTFDARTPRGTVHVESRMVGRANAYNILAAVAAAVALDLPLPAIEAGIANLHAVPGRFQLVSDSRDDVRVVVDYAHTDDALKNLLETARPLATGRIITVFGCGGDRDRTKRPLMGAVAARLSDVVVVTSDNPRSENPADILEQIKRGIVSPDDRGAHAFARRSTRRALSDHRRSQGSDRAGGQRGQPGRFDPDCRQGPREIPGHRRTGAAVRRRGRGEVRAGAAPRRQPGVLRRGVVSHERH